MPQHRRHGAWLVDCEARSDAARGQGDPEERGRGGDRGSGTLFAINIQTKDNSEFTKNAIMRSPDGNNFCCWRVILDITKAQLTLDDFLRELNNRMRMVVLEGR